MIVRTQLLAFHRKIYLMRMPKPSLRTWSTITCSYGGCHTVLCTSTFSFLTGCCRWGNQSMKFPGVHLSPCIFSDEGTCKSLELRCTKGALDSYCTPGQFRLFNSQGVVPPRGPCLLCARDLVTSTVVAAQNVIRADNSAVQRYIATTYPSVDEPGGYHSQFVLQPSQNCILATPFVRSSMGRVSVRQSQTPDPTFSGWYVDQNDLVFTGSQPLN